MSTISLEELLGKAMMLSEGDRMKLVGKILETLPIPEGVMSVHDADFLAELDRRSGDWTGALSWEEMRDRIRHKLP